MSDFALVIVFSLIGSVFSLLGGALLLTRQGWAKAMAEYATPFAAGALLAAAFFDLLREGLESESAVAVLNWTLGGLLLFFLLESLLNWFHHHHEHQEDEKRVDPTASLVIMGDTVHNFIDGAAIAAAFLVSVPTGIVTTFAVAAHEIPQEIGDFGLLLKKGMKRRQVLMANLLSALATVVAAIIFYQLGQANESLIAALLGLAAGFFIYIAVSDIIPSIHESTSRRSLNIKSVILILGVLVVGLVTYTAHEHIDANQEHSRPGHSATAEGEH